MAVVSNNYSPPIENNNYVYAWLLYNNFKNKIGFICFLLF